MLYLMFKDAHNDNTAIIEEVRARPYKGAAPGAAFRLQLCDEHGNGNGGPIIYHVSMHETVADAMSNLLKSWIGFLSERRY